MRDYGVPDVVPFVLAINHPYLISSAIGKWFLVRSTNRYDNCDRSCGVFCSCQTVKFLV